MRDLFQFYISEEPLQSFVFKRFIFSYIYSEFLISISDK